MSDTGWPNVLTTLLEGNSLNESQSSWAMERIMQAEATPAQFGAFVSALRAKGETVDEILGLVKTMRRFSKKISVDFPVLDTCGTGGDRAGTINVSTIAAFVAAGAGAKVAKHGNRAASSACGSADLLEELGVKLELEPKAVATCIENAGIGFCFAPIFHPAMRHAAGLRRELGIRTIFNFLGPLTNPAGATHQVIGVPDQVMAPKMAEVLKRLGTVHSLVVRGSDGLDEVTTTGPSDVWAIHDGEVKSFQLVLEDFGVEGSEAHELRGGTPTENAKIALEVLSGTRGPARDVVVVNAACALIAYDMVQDLSVAVAKANESIESGRARESLDMLIDFSNRL
ncbi:MAG: anthranilate phosphoribosyltransferase [Actinomycetota bacterium]|nr:anthranilate phosphoribosyltransferase [Actinomycetota bacterium]